MQSCWLDSEATAAVARYAPAGIGRDLALCVYSTRLLGQEPNLVLHGGGNTSVKTRLPDLLGEETETLCIKGSGVDMSLAEPASFAPVRLAALRKLRQRQTLSDEDMTRIARANLLDPWAPSPSVETLLHAFLPHRYVNHTHANAVLSVVDQPNGAILCSDIYDGRAGIVPYVMPGFGLAKRATEVYEAKPDVEGLILLKHGIFTFDNDARDAYERMIALVTHAEEHVRRNRKSVLVGGTAIKRPVSAASVAPIVRGACSLKDERIEGAWLRLLLDFRTSPAILDFVNGAELMRYSQAGVVTPDHTIRTKNWPLVLPAPEMDDLGAFKSAANAAARRFIESYRIYFSRNQARTQQRKIMLDPLPRVALVPGLGLFGLGPSKKEAAVAADIAESAICVIRDAEAIGLFESISEAEMFDMEYWALEQAKLGAPRELPLRGQVAAITGAGGAIGAATARMFAAAGAEVALLDADLQAATNVASTIGDCALALECNVTDAASVGTAFEAVASSFGGLDILISNAGAAWQGRIGELDEAILRKSFELNFFAHQRVAQAALKLMLMQATGGCLLFNVSKQAVNPGPNFGPYGLPKAATLLLVRQYALEYGAEGIRANAVNADRVRSGLLTDDLITERAQARGVSEADYLRGNLLRREVTADDVAQAFLHQAMQLKTSGNVTTVDGGNIAAALR
ncbi:MAG: bifunctional aldolase/short-chain dehydrogenase [Xanthobacteraceae bacterium]